MSTSWCVLVRLARLSSFFRFTWISRVPLWSWLSPWNWTAAPRQGTTSGKPQTCRPFLEQLEALLMPNDPFGVLQSSILGASFAQLTPGNVMAQGWGTVSNPAPEVLAGSESSLRNVAEAAPPESSFLDAAAPAAEPITNTVSTLTLAAEATAAAVPEAQTTSDIEADPFADPLLQDWMTTLTSPFPDEPAPPASGSQGAPISPSAGGSDGGSGGPAGGAGAGTTPNAGESTAGASGAAAPTDPSSGGGSPLTPSPMIPAPSPTNSPNASQSSASIPAGANTSLFGAAGPTTSPDIGSALAKLNSTTTLTLSPNASSFAGPITFTANVTGPAGTPTGTVAFFDGATALGTEGLDGTGTAALTTANLIPGRHDISAVYSGDNTYLASSDDPLLLANSTTTLTSSENPSTVGDSVTFSVNVTGPAGTPTGTVTFSDGGNIVDTETLDGSGDATFTTSDLSVGSHTITANYAGDGNYYASTSNTVNQTVNQAASTTTITSSENPSDYCDSVTFSAVVSGPSGTPTGNITFYDGSTALDYAGLDGSGTAFFTTSDLSVGAAHYHGRLRG